MQYFGPRICQVNAQEKMKLFDSFISIDFPLYPINLYSFGGWKSFIILSKPKWGIIMGEES